MASPTNRDLKPYFSFLLENWRKFAVHVPELSIPELQEHIFETWERKAGPPIVIQKETELKKKKVVVKQVKKVKEVKIFSGKGLNNPYFQKMINCESPFKGNKDLIQKIGQESILGKHAAGAVQDGGSGGEVQQKQCEVVVAAALDRPGEVVEAPPERSGQVQQEQCENIGAGPDSGGEREVLDLLRSIKPAMRKSKMIQTKFTPPIKKKLSKNGSKLSNQHKPVVSGNQMSNESISFEGAGSGKIKTTVSEVGEKASQANPEIHDSKNTVNRNNVFVDHDQNKTENIIDDKVDSAQIVKYDNFEIVEGDGVKYDGNSKQVEMNSEKSDDDNLAENNIDENSNIDDEDIDSHKCSDKPEWHCRNCGKRYLQLKTFSVHKCNKTPPYKIPCPSCSKLISKSNMSHHMKVHSARNKLKCNKCKITFENEELRKEHVKNHSQHLCSVCGKTYKRPCLLKDHISTHDQEELTDINNSADKPAEEKKDKIYICKICKDKFPSITVLKIHMNMKHKESGVKCDECGKTFFSVRGMKDHMEAHTKLNQKEPSDRIDEDLCDVIVYQLPAGYEIVPDNVVIGFSYD